MTGTDIVALRYELERRAAMTVTFHDWDPFILGEVDVLQPESIRAGDLARKEGRITSSAREFRLAPLQRKSV